VRYKIPYGGLFEYVSAANLAAEILEWFGFAIACWSLPALTFACFTFFNTAPRGRSHHKWYIEKFEEYPKNRKAVIPFIW
jgi:3-oxo-5-alpha-steroid 4-dehydrogenase 1